MRGEEEEQQGDDADEEIEERKERQHFSAILRAFAHYPRWALARVARLEGDYGRLSARHQTLLDTAGKIADMRRAVHANADLLERIVGPHRQHVGAAEEAARASNAAENARTRVLVNRPDGNGTAFVSADRADYVPESDMEKLQSTIKQFVREWGAEGAPERECAHRPALDALRMALPGGAARGDRVLLPGSGMGRLAWECANLGYTAQGSEFSYFMLLAGNFVLNGLKELGSIEVHPWVLQTCNVRQRADLLRANVVPDVAPWSLPDGANLSMVAGDFLEVYRDQSRCWEAVLTCFFIDTAHNIAHYIGRIRELLVPGGCWVNMGPLLWHFSDSPNEVSVDLSWDELRLLIIDAGFTIEHESWHRAPYVRNVRSMYQMDYDCVCFVARLDGGAQRPPLQPPPPPQ